MSRRDLQNEQEEQKLRGAVSWQRKPIPAPQALSGPMQTYLGRRKRSFARAAGVLDAWGAIVPAGLQRVSRPAAFDGGVLTVEVMPGAYMHQLSMMQHELIEEIKRRCPRCGLRKIRLMPMIEMT